MNLSYRARRNLLRWGIIALVVVLVSTLIWGCWLVWLDRHIVYTRDGAVLDFELTGRDPGEGELAVPPEAGETISIYYNDGSELEEADTSLRQISGFYINAAMLAGDLDTIRATVATLPVGSAVMIEVKNIRGVFHYTTGIEDGPIASDLDVAAVDNLIADIASRNLYLIASVPAFRDRNYGLVNTACGLPYIGGGGALWLDDSGCYWLDPAKSGTLDYLQQIAKELEKLGFDEVMFTDFRFPETTQIDYAGNKLTAIQEAATTLVAECATDRFAVSFMATGSTVKPVTGRSRLYLVNEDVAQATTVAAGYTVTDPAVDLVFMTGSYDTRFETWSVLRPMDNAVTE